MAKGNVAFLFQRYKVILNIGLALGYRGCRLAPLSLLGGFDIGFGLSGWRNEILMP